MRMLRQAAASTRHDAVVRLQQRGVDGEVGGRARVRLRQRNKERRKRALVSERTSERRVHVRCGAGGVPSASRPRRVGCTRVVASRGDAGVRAPARRRRSGARTRVAFPPSVRTLARHAPARSHPTTPHPGRTPPAHDPGRCSPPAARSKPPSAPTHNTHTRARTCTHASPFARTRSRVARAGVQRAHSAPHAHAASRARAWSMTSFPP